MIALRRRRHDDLQVDAHRIEVVQSLGEFILRPADPRVTVDLLLCVHFFCVGRGKEGQRDRRNIKMRRTIAAAAGTDTWE